MHEIIKKKFTFLEQLVIMKNNNDRVIAKMNIELLRKVRKEKKISYDDLAKMTGFSRSTITNIFCGYIEYPRFETIQAIERALGIDNQPQKVNQYDFTDDEIELIEAYRKVLPSLKGYAKETVMRLAGMKIEEQRERKNG